jgi:hypothetical protein
MCEPLSEGGAITVKSEYPVACRMRRIGRMRQAGSGDCVNQRTSSFQARCFDVREQGRTMSIQRE